MNPERRANSAQPLTVLTVADEWRAAHGGLSTLNRHLCTGLVRAGAQVYCQLPEASLREYDHAAGLGVSLVQTPPRDRGGLPTRPAIPAGVVPDIVVGHGRVTGLEAKLLTEHHFPAAARMHFVHVAPDELEWFRTDCTDDPGLRAEQRSGTELALGRDATRVLTVGPRLHLRLQRDLHVMARAAAPLRFDPGFDIVNTAPRTPAPGGPVQVLVLGRLHDRYIKGVDLAARFMARAVDLRGPDEPELELLVRGAVLGECSTLRDQIQAWAGNPGLLVSVRAYSTDHERIQEDLTRAHLVLVPSRSEGFGLVGLEAIIHGTPTLISSRSGLGMLLRETLPPELATRVVIPMTLDEELDVARWGHHIAAVLRSPSAAFTTAETVRRTMAHRRTWAMAVQTVLGGLP